MDPSDLELVRGVRATPSLFNPMNADFKFANRKENIWADLASYLGISMNDARRRWTCLRDRYSRELKSRRLSPKTDYGNDEFFREMDFLRPFVRKRKERRSILCKIKSDTRWDGKAEKHSFDTSDSYSSKTEPTSYTVAEVNVDEVIFPDYEETKCESRTIVMDSNNEDDRLLNEEAYEEEYQVQEESPLMVEESEVITNTSGCEIVTADESPHHIPPNPVAVSKSKENEDDFFCKSIGSYLRQLSRVHKIKAQVEMFQILQKYIELEDT